MDLVHVIFMINRNSPEVVVKTLHKEALNSNFLLMRAVLGQRDGSCLGPASFIGQCSAGKFPLGRGGWLDTAEREAFQVEMVHLETNTNALTERIGNRERRDKGGERKASEPVSCSLHLCAVLAAAPEVRAIS